MWMGWGPDLTFFYNDAYARDDARRQAPVGARPAVARSLGGDLAGHRAAHRRACCGPGEATWDEELLLFLERSGYPEETYHTFSYSPVTDDSGAVCRQPVRRHRGDRARHRRAADGAAARHGGRASPPTITEAELFARARRSRWPTIAGPAVHADLLCSTRAARGAAGVPHRHRRRSSRGRAARSTCRRADALWPLAAASARAPAGRRS